MQPNPKIQPRKKTRHKKANGEGTVIELPNGKFKAIISVEVNGKRRRPSRTASKRSDAYALLLQLRAEAAKNPTAFADADNIDVKTYLESWLDGVVSQASESTKDLYKTTVENHIAPKIGQIRLRKLNGLQIQEWITGLQRDEVGTRTVELAYTTLRNALNYACDRLDLIPKNPVLRIPKPAHKRKDIFPFEEAESARLIDMSDGTRDGALIRMGVSNGPRQGELFGLKWTKVDLKKGTMLIDVQVTEQRGILRVDVPLKTESSRRLLELTPETVESLKRHRAILMAEGNAGSPFVFPAPEGGPQSRGNFRIRVWKPLLVEAGLKHRGFHHVRHTYAAISLGANCPIAVLSKTLGHAKISITMDTYGHLLEGQTKAAKDIMTKKFG